MEGRCFFHMATLSVDPRVFSGWLFLTGNLVLVFSYLHSLQLTWHLKIDGWNMNFLLGCHLVRCYVSFREDTLRIQKKNSKMRVFLRTKKKNCSVTRNHFGLAGPTGDSKGTWVFLNTFSKAIQPRFYELRKIWDMTLTWIFLVQTSRTCLGEMFPKLVISRFSWNNKSFLEQQNIHQKKKSPSTSKRTQVSKKKTSSQVSLEFFFILLRFLVNFLFI